VACTCEYGIEFSGFIKCEDLLASQDGLCFMELVGSSPNPFTALRILYALKVRFTTILSGE
jgi:hypothetical protein